MKNIETKRYCVSCGDEIHILRLQFNTMVQTCSTECAEANAKYQRRENARKWRIKNKKKRTNEKQPG